MNKQRRKLLQAIIEDLENIQVNISAIAQDEADALESLPEGLQESEKGQAMSEAVDFLADAENDINDIIENIREAIEK